MIQLAKDEISFDDWFSMRVSVVCWSGVWWYISCYIYWHENALSTTLFARFRCRYALHNDDLQDSNQYCAVSSICTECSYVYGMYNVRVCCKYSCVVTMNSSCTWAFFDRNISCCTSKCLISVTTVWCNLWYRFPFAFRCVYGVSAVKVAYFWWCLYTLIFKICKCRTLGIKQMQASFKINSQVKFNVWGDTIIEWQVPHSWKHIIILGMKWLMLLLQLSNLLRNRRLNNACLFKAVNLITS